MDNELTSRQKINAELAARAGNKKSIKILRHHIPRQEQAGLKISFTCECADPTCNERIPLTLQEYDELHTKYARFVVAEGHVDPSIEKVAEADTDLTVVDKYALS